MVKISLRERLKLWRKEKIWLLPQENEWCERYGIKSYDAVKSNGLHTSIWAAEDNLGKIRLTKLSNKYNSIAKVEVPDVGLYICGTEGIFFKKNGELMQHIYDGKYYKAVMYPDVLKVRVFPEDESNYIVGRLEAGKFIIEGEGNAASEIPKYLKYDIISKYGNI